MGTSPSSCCASNLGDASEMVKDSNVPGRFGKDSHTFENGATYTGEWKGTCRHGKGAQIWPDGARYEGDWIDDKATGSGRFEHVDGDVYEGQWRDDKAHGHGTYYHADGSKYEGQWQDDKQHGQGTEMWPDGAKYTGSYVHGNKSGPGHFAWADGSSYQGEFLNNDIHGAGIYKWSDGRKFDGQWARNRMHGFGQFSWVDGRSYEGQYVSDQKDGEGAFGHLCRASSDGLTATCLHLVAFDGAGLQNVSRQYDGQWKNGKQHGIGIYCTARGDKRRGEWEEGRRTCWLGPAEQQKTENDGVSLPWLCAVQREFGVSCKELDTTEIYQAKITWKLRYLHWLLDCDSRSERIARSDVALPFAWPSHAWLQIFNGTDSTDQRKSAKVQCPLTLTWRSDGPWRGYAWGPAVVVEVMKYVHLSLILSWPAKLKECWYTVRQEAMVALQKAAIGGDGGTVDVETDDLFVVISPAYAFFHKAIEKEGLDGGLCEVLDRGDAFGEAFHLFAQQVNVAQIAQFCPSPLDKALGKTAYEVVRGEAPAPGDCGEHLECQQAADMFCPLCLHSDHLEGEYWFPVDMMAATVMNALAAGVGVTADHLDGLSKRCKHFFEGKFFGPKFH
ncbi:PIP5K9 [Symbiodinium necroappetens]|uniref:PIP5K9 protein n=1 Tax=Symbiodinium necroappetens TaxID=1628268 RepID=A0A813BPD4_9DINO|nr:PIP5K9 [Symbiodinium necroappetens]